MYALIDASNFYATCHKIFRPSLNGKPVVVLGSNDGCVIARSNEARALGIKMGEPWFKIRHHEEKAGLVALSANFALYGDISDRMMSLASGLGPAQEIYSIDESFVSLAGVRGDLTARAWAIRSRILRWIGMPCGIGIGPTKTLAKLANHVAKSAERKPGSYPAELALVCNLAALPAADVQAILRATEVGDVWGVGRRYAQQLGEYGVITAHDLAAMDPAVVRRRWGVVLERTSSELRGLSCIPFDESPEPKQQIACTRSFGAPITDLHPLAEAVSSFATRACEKLRRQQGLASQVLVFAHTSPFRDGPRYSKSIVVPLRRPTADTSQVVNAAVAGLRQIYKPGYQLAKAGVMLLDLVPQVGGGHAQGELALDDDDNEDSRKRLMAAMDTLNDRFGRGTVHVASTGANSASKPWQGRQDRATPHYTTRLEDIPVARA